MQYNRLLNKSEVPTNNDILNHISKRVYLWESIHHYITNNYDYVPELYFFTKNTDGQSGTGRTGKRYVICFLRKMHSQY